MYQSCYTLAMTSVESIRIATRDLTFSQAVGMTVNQHLFVNGLSRAELGRALDTSGQNVSHKIHGRIKWGAEELAILASVFGVTPNDLVPEPDGQGGWTPAAYVPGHAKSPVPAGTGPSDSVAGTGFEPATSGL